MAVIFSYPEISLANIAPSDRFVLSKMDEPTNPTRSITIGTLASYISTNITPPPAVIPWPYVYNLGNQNFLQGSSPILSGFENTGLGVDVFPDLTSGIGNVAIGDSAGRNLQSGGKNIAIGSDNRFAGSTVNNTIVIGATVDAHNDNTVVLGNNDTVSWESSIANIVDLGTSTFPFKDYYGEGNINLGNINSRIGVGLAYGANTRGAVEVNAVVNFNGAPFNYFIPNGVIPTGYPIGVFDYYTGTDLFGISYWGVGRIMGSAIHIFSDERSKVIQGVSKSKEDLDILNNIEITEFNYIDPEKSNCSASRKSLSKSS